MSESYNELNTLSQERWASLTQGSMPWVRVGTAICGQAAGAPEVLDSIRQTLKKKNIQANVSEVGCFGLCYAEPLVDILLPGGNRILYANVTPEVIEDLLESVLVNGVYRPDLALAQEADNPIDGIPLLHELSMMKHQVRIAMRNCGQIDPTDILQYIARGGYRALDKAISSMEPQEVQEEVSKSGLRGRGGAAFPTGTKWRFLSGAPGPTKYILCNCEEGDPGSFNDKNLLESDPQSVLEGVILAGYATGASNGYIFIRHGHEGPIARTWAAIEQARRYGLLGTNILNSGFSFDVEVALTGESYVAGEETALMEAIEGDRAMPRFRPPFPAAYGVWGKPSNINNVKTLAYVPEIVANGGEWYAGIGTESGKGTFILCLTGNIKYPGMIEIPMGVTYGEVIHDMAGGTRSGKMVKILQTGGPLNSIVNSDKLETGLDFDSMARSGAVIGSGGIVVADDDACAVDLTRMMVSFCQFESCGKCFPCRLGTQHLKEIMNRICGGQSEVGDMELMQRIGRSLISGSLCGHGQLGFNPVQSAFDNFSLEFSAHIEQGKCSTGRCSISFVTPARTTRYDPAGGAASRFVPGIPYQGQALGQ